MKNAPVDVALQPFQPIANSLVSAVTYSVELPASYDYWKLDLVLAPTTFTAAMLTEIRLKVNGQIIQRVAGTDLNVINQYYKCPAYNAGAANILSLFQRRLGIRGGSQLFPNGKTVSGSSKDLSIEPSLNAGSFDSQNRGISSIILEIDVNNTPAAGTLTITPFGQGLDPYPGGPGLLTFFEKTVFNAVSGANTLTKANALLFGDIQHMYLDCLTLIPASGTLDLFTLWLNNNQVFIRADARNRQTQQEDGLRTPQAGYYMIDYTERGWGDEDLLIGQSTTDMRLLLTTSASGGITIYQKSLGYLFPPMPASAAA